MHPVITNTASQNRTVVIAGYSEGFGTALEERFVNAGYQVVGVARHQPAHVIADLSDPVAAKKLFAHLDNTYPPLAGVIHNAMQFLRLPLMDTSAEQMESIWRSMVMTAFVVTQNALPRLLLQGGGSLIYSGASGSLQAGSGFAAFSSAKFALRGLVQATHREHAANGIHVSHVVIDGLIRSEKTAERFASADQARTIEPVNLAEQYFQLFHQPSDSWTQELDIRPQTITIADKK